MEVIYIVIGGSVGVILMALGIDLGSDVVREWNDNRKTQKIREAIEDQALSTLAVACRLKTTVTYHRPHGTHRRIPVS